ncbi:hypothetical protein XENOCAPTIV_018018, partial [Xenoophorus captivus]
LPLFCVAMDMAWQVEFRNVGCTYFPQSRVDCHYTLSSQHSWANSDWIGLFKEYEFVYVDAKGEVCSCSSKFTFCAPKPLEDMVTLEEESHGEGEGTDMLLVIPRAELLQNRLQECLRERAELLREQEVANKQREREKEDHKREKQEWDRQRRGLEREVGRLKEELMQSHRKIEEMEMEQKDEQALGECLAQEKAALMDAKAAKEQLIRELEEDIKTLTQRSVERETELERMKERAKRAIALRKEEEHERKNQQNKLDQTEAELRSLFKEFQVLRNSLAQRDTSVLQLQNTITTLTQKLTTAHRKETESEVLLKEMRTLRERFHMSERTVEGLKSDLSTLAAQRDRVQAELHQTRVQAAQLTIQLADASMALREGRANWAQDRQNLQHTAELDQESLEKLNTEMQKMQERLQEEKMERVKLEVELGREKDCNRELMEYIFQMEQKTGTVTTARWDTVPIASTGCPETALSDSEDESPEALQILHPPRSLGHYSLCEQGQPESLLLSTPPLSPRDVDRSVVVINQPAPLSLPHQANADTLPHSSDSVRRIRATCCHHSVIICNSENELRLPTNSHAPVKRGQWVV